VPQDISLKERDLILMRSLIEAYMQEGQPVGSKTLLTRSRLKISPATVRNVMADLERQGLVLSPHTSAGRIPTQRGLRIFVDHLLQIREPEQQLVQHLKNALRPGQDTEQLIQNTSSLLSSITRMASIVQVPKQDIERIEHIDFVPLSDNRLLVVLVMEDQSVQNRVIQAERSYTREQLLSMANYLNQQIVGKPLREAYQTLLQQMNQERQQLDSMMQQAIELARQGVEFSRQQQERYQISGHSNLASMANQGQLGDLERVFNAFRQKQEVMSLLERSMIAEGVKIFIGSECGHRGLSDCSVVSAPYKLNGKPVGVLAVVGPTRMAYDRVIPIVDITAKLLTGALSQRH